MHLTMRSQFPLRKWVVSIAAASCDWLVAEAVLGVSVASWMQRSTQS